jgi:hypothetical protein
MESEEMKKDPRQIIKKPVSMARAQRMRPARLCILAPQNLCPDPATPLLPGFLKESVLISHLAALYT